jgi:hypothetical protein
MESDALTATSRPNVGASRAIASWQARSSSASGAPVEPARRDSVYEQMLVEEVVAGVHETAADGSLAAIPPGTMR